jgi:hypothetical protein
VLEPKADGAELDEAEVVGRGLVAARCDQERVLQATDGALDPVAKG